ncbi:hypothetical protein MKW98_000779 [Papaver atlanticum]|uniref:Uncharacterized protein n=1 Tax=Papaver atlanticum TaxID=357466 RepID=A0AAD4SF61_9MAGN|nr:hypothetical protein MKW98_000779 [Papaver atlanticum]
MVNRKIKRTITEEITEESPSPSKRRKTANDSPIAANSPRTRSMTKAVTPPLTPEKV